LHTGKAPQSHLITRIRSLSRKPFLDHYKLTVDWTTLDGYFQRLEKQGTPINIGT
jgi:hypothetical protein